MVAHRRAVHPELVKVTAPGMGVRFLSPEELVHELFPREEGKGGGEASGTGQDVEDPAAESRTFTLASCLMAASSALSTCGSARSIW